MTTYAANTRSTKALRQYDGHNRRAGAAKAKRAAMARERRRRGRQQLRERLAAMTGVGHA